MRAFDDQDGRRWDAIVGRESYGIQVILFLAQDSGEVRKAVMASSTRLEALRELDALTDAELCARLGESQPWDSATLFPG